MWYPVNTTQKVCEHVCKCGYACLGNWQDMMRNKSGKAGWDETAKKPVEQTYEMDFISHVVFVYL